MGQGCSLVVDGASGALRHAYGSCLARSRYRLTQSHLRDYPERLGNPRDTRGQQQRGMEPDRLGFESQLRL